MMRWYSIAADPRSRTSSVSCRRLLSLLSSDRTSTTWTTVLRVLWFLLDDAIPFDRMWRVSEARHLQFLAELYATGRLTD